MKILILSSILIISWMSGIAQTRTPPKAGSNAATPSTGAKAGAGSATTPSTAGTTIIYNNSKSINPDQEVFPIDRPFSLEIDSIPTNHIYNIYVYPVESGHGTRRIIDKKDKLKRDTGARASFEIIPSKYFVQGNTITLRFPPIKAEEQFDIAIIKQFSQRNMARAMNLNQFLDRVYLPDMNPGITPKKLEANQKTADSLLQELIDSASDRKNYPELKLNYLVARRNGNRVLPPNSKVAIRIDNIGLYRQYFLDPLRDVYYRLVHTVPEINHTDPKIKQTTALGEDCFWTDKFYSKDTIHHIATLLNATSPLHNRLFILQKMLDYKFDDVLTGKIRIDTSGLDKPVNPYDFNTRVLNIVRAYKFLDSLNNALMILNETAKPNQNIDSLEKWTQSYLSDLLHNKILIDQSAKKINDLIEMNSTENIWVIGQSTKSPDLTTYGSRRFAINAGVTTIFAYDNSSKIACIPKLFLGIDYHLKSFDKNADFNDASPVGPETDTLTHVLEAKQGLFDHFSITLGVTFGPMTNSDFTNTYGSFSFTFGPSYTIGKYIKFGAGIAVIHRYDNNPLLSSTDHAIFGPYASVSVDYDILSIVSSVTSSLFK